MPSLLPKYTGNTLTKIWFFGSFDELTKAGKLLGLKPTDKLAIPIDQVYISNLLNLFPNTQMDSRVAEWYDGCLQKDGRILEVLNSEGQQITVGNYVLYPFQEICKRFIEAGKRVLIADDRGTGKTVEAVTTLVSNEFDTALIVVRTYLFQQWIETFKKADPNGRIKLFPLAGTKERLMKTYEDYKNTSKETPKVILCSYNALSRPNYAFIFSFRYQWIVFDEAHTLCNHKNVTTKMAWQLTEQKTNVILLTGSDIQGKYVGSYWSLLKCLDPIRFSNYSIFQDRYVESYLDTYGKVPVASKHMDELAEVLSTLRLRRTLDEVGFQLPEQIITKVHVDLEPTHRAIYDGMIKEELDKDNFEITKGIPLFSYLQRLVSFPKSLGFESYDPKLTTITGLVEDIASEGGKVLIFGIHKEFLRHVHWFLNNSKMKSLNGNTLKFVHFDGDTSQFIRDDFIEQFKTDDDCIGLIATMKTGGEGLDFPDCDNIITIEGHWNPEVMNQVYGRILRITSKRNKRVYNIICRNTIDDYIDFVATDKENFISEANQMFKVYQMMKGGK